MKFIPILNYKVFRCGVIGNDKNKRRITIKSNRNHRAVHHTPRHVDVTLVLQLILIHFLMEIEINVCTFTNCHSDMHSAMLQSMSAIYSIWNKLEYGWISLEIKHYGNHRLIMHQDDTLKNLFETIEDTFGLIDCNFYLKIGTKCINPAQMQLMKLMLKELPCTNNTIIEVCASLLGGVSRKRKRNHDKEEMDYSSSDEDATMIPKKRKISHSANALTENCRNSKQHQPHIIPNNSTFNDTNYHNDEEKYPMEDVNCELETERNPYIHNHLSNTNHNDNHNDRHHHNHNRNRDHNRNHNHNYNLPNMQLDPDFDVPLTPSIHPDEVFEQTAYLNELLQQQDEVENTHPTVKPSDRQPNPATDAPVKKQKRRKKRGRKRTVDIDSHHSRARLKQLRRRKTRDPQKQQQRQINEQQESFVWNSKEWVRKLFPKATQPYRSPKFRFRGGIDKLNSKARKFDQNYIGKMDQECPHCGALLFKSELSASPNKWNLCCKNGKIKLNHPHNPPADLYRLFTSSTPLAKYFQDNIILINSALSLSSSQIYRKELPFSSRRAPPTFIVSGQVYHTIPLLVPEGQSAPKQAQIYTWDPQQELDNRLNQGFISKLACKPMFKQLIKELQQLLHDYNWIVKTYKTVFEEYLDNAVPTPELKLIVHSKISDSTNLGHYKTFTKPSQDSPICTMVKFSDITDPVPTHRKLMLTTREQKETRTFSEIHSLSDAFAFPLLYPYGECSYNVDLKKSNNKKLTMTEYYRYRLFERKDEWNPFIHGQRLFQQYISATWAKIQQNTMNWYINHQKECRADSYDAIHKARRQNKDLKQLGKKLNILPASFIESPRYFRSKYQNAMAILRQIGSIPDFFITFTANAKWREITETIERHEVPLSCRDDVIARVFRAKLKQLLHDLIKLGALGMYPHT